MGRFILKHIDSRKPQKKNVATTVVTENKVEETTANKENEVMTTSEKIEMAQSVLGNTPNVKRVKKDKGLIERVESTKTVLTEDNRELLKD